MATLFTVISSVIIAFVPFWLMYDYPPANRKEWIIFDILSIIILGYVVWGLSPEHTFAFITNTINLSTPLW